MIHSGDMNETAGMLEARLRLVEHIRRVEHALARDEQAKVAAALMKGHSHELGNLLQIVKLSAVELERRVQGRDGCADLVELTTDMRQAGDSAATVLGAMFAVARPAGRTEVGPIVGHAVRAAVDLARPAFAGTLELRIDLADTVHTHSSADELETMILASLLDAVKATHVAIVVRERVISGKRWVEILRIDDRQHFDDGELGAQLEAGSLLHTVASAAKQAGGDVSLAPGRGNLELAIELPVATL